MAKRIAFITVLAIVISLYCVPCFIDRAAARDMDRNIPKVWSIEAHYLWVGKISNFPDGLSINVNGKHLESKNLMITNYDKSIHVRLPLEYAAGNLISIREDDAILFQADIFYAPTFEAQLVPEEYLLIPFHSEENEKECLSCHRLEVTINDALSNVNSEHICYPCHKRKFSGREHQHYAAGVTWECMKCHQTGAIETDYSIDGPVKFTIKEGAAVAPLCFQCHINRKKEIEGYTYLHGPIGMQLCITCHDPHGSNHDKLLQKEVVTLCIECHRKSDILNKPTVHSPVADDCLNCHDPHGSNFPYFLEADINSVCMECHSDFKQKMNDHPIRNHPVSGPKDPNDTDRAFTCVSCHDPHSSTFKLFLTDDDIVKTCVRCHPQYK